VNPIGVAGITGAGSVGKSVTVTVSASEGDGDGRGVLVGTMTVVAEGSAAALRAAPSGVPVTDVASRGVWVAVGSVVGGDCRGAEVSPGGGAADVIAVAAPAGAAGTTTVADDLD